MKTTTTLLIVMFCSLSALGETYRWVDDRGGTHFTDDFTQIPEKYRAGIQKISAEESNEPTQSDQNLPRKGKGSAPKDRLGRGEQYWKGRAEELRNKIKGLAERNELLRSRYNELTLKHNDSRGAIERADLRKERDQIKSEMDRNRIEMDEAKLTLEKKLPEEAELFQAKQEWIR